MPNGISNFELMLSVSDEPSMPLSIDFQNILNALETGIPILVLCVCFGQLITSRWRFFSAISILILIDQAISFNPDTRLSPLCKA